MSGTDFKDVLSDVTSHALIDVGESYQEILLQDTAITPPEGAGSQDWVTTTEITGPETEPPVELEEYDAPTNDPIPGLDIG